MRLWRNIYIEFYFARRWKIRWEKYQDLAPFPGRSIVIQFGPFHFDISKREE